MRHPDDIELTRRGRAAIVPAMQPRLDGDLVAFTTGAWRERIGWWRAAVVSFVVITAAAAVVVPSVGVLRHYRQLDSASAGARTLQIEPIAQSAVPQSAAPAQVPPAVPSTMAPSVVPAPAAAAAPAATQASGRAAAGVFTVAFVVDPAELRIGMPASVSVSATGDADDRVSSVVISTADGTVLTSGGAAGCEGPAFPWTQSFAVVFAHAESTQLQVALTSCAGGSLVATALIDIQP